MKPKRFHYALLAVLGGAGLWWALTSRGRVPVPAPAGAAAAERQAADALGYSAAFEAELKKVGQISPREFARRYAMPA